MVKTSLLNKKSWLQAAYLNERRGAANANLENDIGRLKAEKWSQRTGLDQLGLLTRRLQYDHLTEAEFISILGQDVPESCVEDADWFKIVTAIFDEPIDVELLDNDIPFELRNKAPFFSFVIPFLKWSKHEVNKQLKELRLKAAPNLYLSEQLVCSLLKPIYESLLTLACPTLILELNAARLANELQGETREARFEHFIATRLTRPEDIVVLLEKYPVLGRMMCTSMKYVIAARMEAIEHLLLDHEQIQTVFGSGWSECVEVDSGGDLHNGGRSVLIFTFQSGKKLVYKPRSLSVDVHFQNLLSWINEKGIEPSYPILKILPRERYGWEAFISNAPCTGIEQVQRFYLRQGGYLALLYFLDATDFHSENIIAAGEYPYLIDLESLFQNRMVSEDATFAMQIASNKLMESVLRTGLLPVSLFKSGAFQGVEISGLGGYAGQAVPKITYGFADVGTDEMRMVRKQLFLQGSHNRPVFQDQLIQAQDYTEDIMEGFVTVYKLLLEHREELLAEDGPIWAFSNDPIRAIIRDTQSYASMLEAGLHPNYLRDGLDRNQLFDFMWRMVEQMPEIVDIVHSECLSMLDGDVPMFHTKVGSASLWDQWGKETPSYYKRDSMSKVIERLLKLSHEDCQQQLTYIRTSMSTMIKKWDAKLSPRDSSFRDRNVTAAREQYVAAAIQIGDQLERSAIWNDARTEVTWIGLGANEHDQWLFTPLDASLYDGVMGVALFYAYLADVTGIDKYKSIASACLNTGYRFIHAEGAVKTVSAFYGYASFIYVLLHLGHLWDKPELIQQAEQLVERMEPLIEKDVMYDLLSGNAGAIVVCLRLYSMTGSEKALRAAVRCGEHLLSEVKELEVGCGWSFDIKAGHEPIAGLSHGSAGIAWALAELSEATGDKRYVETAARTIEFERTLFDASIGNWSDTRFVEKRQELGLGTPVQWCHGAAGIALGRLMYYRKYPDGKIREEIDIAVQTTVREGFGGSHCLCHGDLGNLEVLLLAAEQFEDDEMKEIAMKYAANTLSEAESNGWFCGIPQEEETPSFMLGLTGIGYGLLRMASINDNPIPSVVVLEGPSYSDKEEKGLQL
ncbi:type 2 lanthipeptide synthetase LanM family protein [Paenibacillus assamensis]|uniref:type 2 lanthipeptide synthetase LanM family protein n=1 Tax=Paenibacillus assamensis TaxID=311244 RepID=UPI00040A6AB6|nr:type 2 lanthipeptide synthetase LanM family protein [Paenibacillus assamensis]